jgi:hypothetical protein
VWLCTCSRSMSILPPTGSQDLPSPTVNTNLLSPSDSIPPSLFYSQSTHTENRPVTPPPNVSNPISTPILNKTSGSYNYASEIDDWGSANYHLAQETSGFFLGTMPPMKFLDKFLPMSQDTRMCPNSRGAFTSVLSAEKQVNMYPPFVSVVFVSVLCFINIQ